MWRFGSNAVRGLGMGLVGALVIAVSGAVAVPATTMGCTTHQCDTSSADFYGGFMVDTTTYETSDISADWVPFPAQVTLHVHFPPGINRAPLSIDTYVGTGPSPNGGPDFQGGDVWAEAPGQLAEIFLMDSTGFLVLNDSCANYYARFVVHFAPVEMTLFGGVGPDGNGGVATLDDTWSWDGASWTTQGSTPQGPEERQEATMGTLSGGAANGATYLFGGYDDGAQNSPSQGYLRDTWQWNGSAWTQFYPVNYPNYRADAASAVLDGQLVMFGGHGPDPANPFNGALMDFGDTWVLQQVATDGGSAVDWTQPEGDAGPAPPARSGASAAVFGSQVLLFGGLANGTPLDDTWVWSGSSWSQVQVSGPSARFHAAMLSLGGPGSEQVLLFGGDSGVAPLGDTWLWNGTSWTQQNVGGPSPRSLAAAATFQGTPFLLGGSQGATLLGDAWIWGPSGWTEQTTGPSARAGAAIAGL